jgi:hypothetical protein
VPVPPPGERWQRPGEQDVVRERVHGVIVAGRAPVETQKRLGAIDAGAGDDQVEVRMALDELRARRIEGLEVGEVAVADVDLGPVGVLAGQRLERVPVAVQQDERRPVLGQKAAELDPDAARSAGHERLGEPPLAAPERRRARETRRRR